MADLSPAFFIEATGMKIKRFDFLLQVKITDAHRQKLQEARMKTGVNVSELCRLSMRLGLPRLLERLPEHPGSHDRGRPS